MGMLEVVIRNEVLLIDIEGCYGKDLVYFNRKYLLSGRLVL